MKSRNAKPQPSPGTPLTEAAFDAALRDDSILPSSGFAASVMAAVQSQSAAPAALAFPWKRALPGVVAALAVLALLLGILIAAAVRAVHTVPHAVVPTTISSFDWHLQLQPLLHSTPSAGAFWLILALALSGLCLLLCRRLVASN